MSTVLFSFAQSPGELDASFGTEGRLIIDLDHIDNCERVLVSDQHIYLFGHTTSTANLNAYDYWITRLSLNGQTDSTFGENGLVRGDFLNKQNSRILDAEFYQGGFLFLGSASPGSGDTQSIILGHYDLQGKPVESFGENGIYSLSLLGSKNDPGDIAITDDNHIIVCGTTYDSAFAHKELPFFGRITPIGVKDEDFANGSGFYIYDPAQGFYPSNEYQGTVIRHAAGGGLYSCIALSNHKYVFGGVYNAADYWGLRIVVDLHKEDPFMVDFSPVTSDMSGYYPDMIKRDGSAFALGAPIGNWGPEDFVFQAVSDSATVEHTYRVDFDEYQDQGQSLTTDAQGRIVMVGFAIPFDNLEPGYRSEYFAVAVQDSPFERDWSFVNQGKALYDFGLHDECGATSVFCQGEYIYVAGYLNNGPDSNVSDVGIIKIHNPNRPTSFKPIESNESHMAVFPNPTTGILNLQIPANRPLHFEIKSLKGKILQTGTTHRQIIAEGLPTGVYNLTLIDGDVQRHIRFVMQ